MFRSKIVSWIVEEATDVEAVGGLGLFVAVLVNSITINVDRINDSYLARLFDVYSSLVGAVSLTTHETINR